MNSTVTVEQLYQDHAEALELKLLAGQSGLKRVIREPTVNRPGLALAGFKRYFAPKRVQVIGNVETAYLRSLDRDTRRTRYLELLSHRIPCLVFCRGLRPDRLLLDEADKRSVPVLQSELITMKFINAATIALEDLFAERGQLHGCMVDIQGIGVIIQGESGIGKSEAVLGLLERGYSLVADDVVRLTVVDGRELNGYPKPIGKNRMEVRGIGLIDVVAMFGIAAIRSEKRVDLIVSLKNWDDAGEVDRLGLEEAKVPVLGIDVPHMTIPVRPGRDLARLIEVAALQTKLRHAGYNAAQVFTQELSAQMQKS